MVVLCPFLLALKKILKVGTGAGNNCTFSGNRNITWSFTESRSRKSSLHCLNVSSMLRRSWPWWLYCSGIFLIYLFIP